MTIRSADMDSWELFETALEVSGEERLELLRRAESSVGAGLGRRDCEAQVLRACIAAVLLGDGLGEVDSVRSEVLAATDCCASGWAGFYLAESGNRLGEPSLVIAAVDAVPAGFFEERDLRWRAVRLVELRIVAGVESGDAPGSVKVRVGELAASYAAHGDSDDYASPRQLVECLLRSGPSFGDSLQVLERSVDLDTWLSPELASMVSTRLEKDD